MLVTHYGIDWPQTFIHNPDDAPRLRAKQQQELMDIMDALVEGNMHAICIHVRPTADALYQSRFEPWSKNLTGTRGLDPGYDPLAFAVEQGHKRGLEVHAWFNPYRITTKGEIDTTDMVYRNCHDWILKYDNGIFFGTIIDPGFPQARKYVLDVIMEAINNYDVDGIIMDDYFYPYGGTTTEDSISQTLYKPAGITLGDWRRDNVNKTMQMLYDSIQEVKPWVRFGMAPFGIWTTSDSVAALYGITLPQGIVGMDDYEEQACNTVEWVKQGYVDYIAPQLYWPTDSPGQDYDVLCQWWAQDVCKHFSDLLPGNQRVDFFVSQACYRYNTEEMVLQIDDNRTFDQLGNPGSLMYNTHTYIDDNELGTKYMHREIVQQRFTSRSLPPAMNWKSAPALPAPTDLSIHGTTLTWSSSADRFTVYAYPLSIPDSTAIADPTYLLGICYDTCLNVAHIPHFDSCAYAICAFDRYANEHTPAIYRDIHPIDCNPYGYESIADMFSDWTQDYNTHYHVELDWQDYATYMAMENPAQQIALITFDPGLMYSLMHTPKWQWLGAYVDSVTHADVLSNYEYADGKKVVELDKDDRNWRFAMSAFWTHSKFKDWPGSANFSYAGLYSYFKKSWGWTWCKGFSSLDTLTQTPNSTQIILNQGHILIRRQSRTYTLLGNPL